MTTAPAPARNPIAQAIEVLDLGLKACEAYGRTDLTARLGTIRRQLADPAVHIVVAGEFKQGKSSLVNALIGANVCPVDDDVATALPTYVRYSEEPKAYLLHDGDPPSRSPIALDQVRAYAVEEGGGRSADRIIGVEAHIPRKILAGGLVLVDTPGVGGLGSAHAAASLAAISMADAVIFVTDSSQELTRSELDFLRQARQLCRTVVCVMTKTDFYPAWRTIHQLNTGHLRSTMDIPLMTVSSSLRSRAVKANDQALNAESGFAELVRFVTDQVGGKAVDRIAGDAAAEVAALCEQIMAQFEAERAALADPAAAQHVLDRLNLARQRVEVLRSNAAKWVQTLSDGIADLNADIDHDLRARIRQVLSESDDSVEGVDPADTWPQMESWLRSRVSYDLLANYTLLRSRADALSEEVADHFRYASGEVFDQLGVYNPSPKLEGARVDHKIELDKMKVGKQAMVALKSAYGGALMFMMLGTMTGIALGPISVGIGLVMGAKGLRDEKKRQLQNRRTQAKNAVRRYCDEVSFVMGKDSRDTLRRVQRQLRDYYSGLAEEMARSNQDALTAATEAVKRTQSERDTRLRDLDAEMTRLRQLRQRASTVVAS